MSSALFSGWQDHLAPLIEVWPVELPGRGRRVSESPFRSLVALAKTLRDDVIPLVPGPVALFGHSMGGLIAYEVAKQLAFHFDRSPAHLLISGCPAPCVPRTRQVVHRLDDDQLVSYLGSFDRNAHEIFDSREARDLLLPMLRADFELVHTYEDTFARRLECPITLYRGVDDDSVTDEDAAGWRSLTHSSFDVVRFPGGHFFPRERRSEVVRRVALDLGI